METKVSSAGKYTKSLRTTIPESMAEVYGIKEGDMLTWSFWMIDDKTQQGIIIHKKGEI